MTGISADGEPSAIAAAEKKVPRVGLYGWITTALRGSDPQDNSRINLQNNASNSLFLTTHQARESSEDIPAGQAHLIQSTMFDEAWLVRTHARARTEGRRTGALIGACVGVGVIVAILCFSWDKD